jgi:hypothetical protein
MKMTHSVLRLDSWTFALMDFFSQDGARLILVIWMTMPIPRHFEQRQSFHIACLVSRLFNKSKKS